MNNIILILYLYQRPQRLQADEDTLYETQSIAWLVACVTGIFVLTKINEKK